MSEGEGRGYHDRLVEEQVDVSMRHWRNALGTYKTVKARSWPWLSGQSPENLVSCSLLITTGDYHHRVSPCSCECSSRKLVALIRKLLPLIRKLPVTRPSEEGTTQNVLPEIQGHNLALTGLCVPSSLNSEGGLTMTSPKDPTVGPS